MEDRILRTHLSMSKITDQYEQAKKMNIDVDEDLKFEFKLEPFNLILSKVSGYMAVPGRSKEIGQECTGVFIDSDYLFVAIPLATFENVMINFLELQNESK